MTNDEINRAVAVGMGWTDIKMRFTPNQWTGAKPGSGGSFLHFIPDFCNDPAAADLVRLEIERRGWDYSEGRYGSRLYHCHITGDQQGRDEWGAEHEQLFAARCLAFLAAVEAEKEVSK